MSPDEIRKAIAELPQDDPAKCEGLIRMLHNQILSLEDANKKEKLLNCLREVGCLGLQEDLKKMMERKGLRYEGFDLVVKFLTNATELAQYLHVCSKQEIEKTGLEIVNRRLGPDLEVLGGLSNAGIDVTKEWSRKLCKKASSFQALLRLRLLELEDCCQGADEGEMDQVHRLVETAESHSKQLSNIPQDENLVEKSKATKAVDEENLKKAKELMNEAKAMASNQSEEAKKTVTEKLMVILNVLQLPPHWMNEENKVKPEQLFQQLDQIIQECSNVVESVETYKNELEVIAKVSGGKALCGIYHSEFQAHQPAGRPLIRLPTHVTFINPSSSQETNLMKFSAKGVATKYVRTVESSSTNIGCGVAGFCDLLVGEVEGAYGSEQQKQTDHSVQTSTTSASVVQYIQMAKKSFQLERDKIQLCLTARKMARSIVQDKRYETENQKSARLFLERYGSHFPAGVQTLGGVFFSIADVESKTKTETSALTEAAVTHLKTQNAFGLFSGALGIGGSATGEYTSAGGRGEGSHSESNTESFTYSVKSMGPAATNPATFLKLLSYNSTWALIDRGSVKGYIPVWELLRDLGSEYEAAANVLEETWNFDEEMRKAKEELMRIKKEHFARVRLNRVFANDFAVKYYLEESAALSEIKVIISWFA